ncbi:MAG: hypothetical protein L6R38_005793 [Xanthoria sp. 2 TBL-2021]|nr:MAG: hypothetical protein L6R38_005793 [Xanthoria sp. 2 TBL-2021]
MVLGLDDLCVRFIINLPQEELESVERICFQVEEAQWYYEDFIRPLDPELPSLNLRNFCLRIFQHCPLLSEFSPYHHATAFEEFLAYKTRVPVRGAIMLNQDMDQVILVKGWKKGANWSFPRGKINKDESDLACAVREVYEETGYDVKAAGLVGAPDGMKYIDVAIQHQHIRLYVFRGVPMDTHFEARTRKEISKIDWWRLSDLPTLKKKKQQQEGRAEDLALNANKFYMVAPFLVPLKKWISQQKRLGTSNSVGQIQHPTEDEVEGLPLGINGVKRDGAVSASEDMGRLLAGLRQPPPESNVKTVPTFNTGSSAEAASVQLKNLLRVPTEHNTEFEAPPSAQESKASTLLALLRGGKSNKQHLEPQTPLELVTESSTIPGSLKPQHMMEPRLAALPPPVFQIDQTQDTQIHTNQSIVPDSKAMNAKAAQIQQASIRAWNTFENTSAKQEAERKRMLSEKRAAELAREEQTGIRHEPRLPVMNETWRQVKVHDTLNMHQAKQRQVVNTLKRPVGDFPQSQGTTADRPAQRRATSEAPSQPTAAPYQATSSVEPLDKSQYQDIYRPTIPAANKLPMPKLTSHSSSLLDLFKNGQRPRTGSALAGSPAPATGLQTTRDVTTNSDTQEQQVQVSGKTGKPAFASPPPSVPTSTVQTMGDAKLPHSTHQASLLELFRKPLASAEASTPPSQTTLDVPVDIVELSAMPSPSHSKHTFKANHDGRQKKPSVPAGEPNSLRKKKNAKHGNPPVSATVNGPLNVPQFEMIARKAETSGNQKPSPLQDVKKSPVTILARPSTAKANEQIGLPESTSPDDQYAKAPSPTIPPPAGLHPRVGQPHGSNPFQPQILRRPPPSPENPKLPQPPTVQSSGHLSNGERDSPSPLSASDQHPAMKPEHKATLLSLFTKASSSPHSPQLISGQDFSAFVSPVATKPPISFPLLSERLSSNVTATVSSAGKGMLPPTRKVSEALPPSVGISRINSTERQMPTKKTTSDVDRNFLLGYLDGVAKKEGR